jgi:hypothetical protein
MIEIDNNLNSEDGIQPIPCSLDALLVTHITLLVTHITLLVTHITLLFSTKTHFDIKRRETSRPPNVTFYPSTPSEQTCYTGTNGKPPIWQLGHHHYH